MENTSESSFDSSADSASESKLPIGLALVGIVLGGLAFIFAFTAKNQITRLSENVNAEVTELNARVEKALAEVRANGGDAQRVDLIAAEVDAFKAQVQTNFQEVGASFQNLAATVESIKNNSTRQTASSSSQRAGTQSNSRSSAGTADSGSTSEYTIKAGDNFWKIARNVGCDSKTLEKLNPGVDSSRLRVGQKIKVPAKR